ncbi:uncharacterized protein BCR38DRAFT_406950 [Pseudomassariella vexata]|uniref:Chitin-binding type-2 domain-containing protein n=1 Tax=Pseudomassariella vexata TaxID=1141098 RepID=A0A1Y2EC15_9PEZI|nr:uncharacterized protein BCR38DRAFT_406950 [Pseudomassariella vexata]ORY69082.1 hypothetical protein BCR38DRAFT_406950 [Pseudomassariella vexata]
MLISSIATLLITMSATYAARPLKTAPDPYCKNPGHYSYCFQGMSVVVCESGRQKWRRDCTPSHCEEFDGGARCASDPELPGDDALDMGDSANDDVAKEEVRFMDK